MSTLRPARTLSLLAVLTLLMTACIGDLAPAGDTAPPADVEAAPETVADPADGDAPPPEVTAADPATAADAAADDGEPALDAPPDPADAPDDGAGSTTPATAPMPMADMPNMVMPDVSGGLPAGDPGTSERVIEPAERTKRTSDGTAAFRIICEYSHMNFDDAIVFPGQRDASHLHVYFGNTDVDATSTSGSIADTGNSTCRGGTVNRSAYWTPALLDTETRRPVVPKFSIVYYKSGYRGVAPESIQAMPEGLRIIAGNAKATTPDENDHVEWVCLGDSSLGGTKKGGAGIPTDCRGGDVLRMIVEFPQCWNGRDLDSADHASHMAYAKDGCPGSHPVPLSQITMNVDYDVEDPAEVRRWRLSSDMSGPDQPNGISMHADWWNGWETDVFETMLEGCYRPAEDCGMHNLNNGTELGRP